MDTRERVRQTIEVYGKAGEPREFNLYLQQLKKEDPMAFFVVEVYLDVSGCRYLWAIKKGNRLLAQASDNPWLACLLLLLIGVSYRGMGEMETASDYFQNALEMAGWMEDEELVFRARLHKGINSFYNAEYDCAYREFQHLKERSPWVNYYLACLSLIRGQAEEAIKNLDSIMKTTGKAPVYFGMLEAKALALRITGKFSEAMEAFIESARGYVDHDSAYSVFPVAKALELSRLAGFEPPPKQLIRKAIGLAKRGSWGEQAAAQEAAALLREGDAEAAEGLFEASENYLRAYQNIEALFSGLTAAYLAWKADSPVFTKALKLIAPLVHLHPGFKKDSLMGDFLSEMEPFLTKALRPFRDKRGIRAYLAGELRVLVDGKEIKMEAWRNNKAIRGLVYLLLSPKHRIPLDHLFYLLWPRRAFNKKNRWCLYKAMDTVRKNLGRRELLTKKRDFYQLEEVWTDLGEMENLIRQADATVDPGEKEELLSRARELAQGDLLPEFPYDRHIDEYRQYYERLKKRIFGG